MGRCYRCKGEEWESVKERVERTIGEHSFRAEVEARKCTECGERLVALSDVGKFEKEVAGWLAREGILSGAAFRFMRKAIGLRGKELAELLDMTPETISRWEKEHQQPDLKAMMVLGDLVLDKLRGEETVLERLRSLGSSPQKSGPIDLTGSFRTA